MTAATGRAAAPDLIVRAAFNRTPSVAPGGTVKVLISVKNIGDASAGASSVRFYLSKDAIKGAGDIRLKGSLAVATLGPGKSSNATKELKVPANTKAASYYIIAAADDRKKVKESREGNNTRNATPKVKVKKPEAPDDFVLIPAGSFQMGDQSDPPLGWGDEIPVHTFM